MHATQVLCASACALSLTLASTAHAQQGGAASGQSGSQSQSTTLGDRMQTSGQMRAGEESAGGFSIGDQMIDQQVKNDQGQDLGKIADAVIDRYGRVQYVMLEPASALNVQGKFIAVPWHAFTKIEDGNWILPVAQDRLASAPSFTKDQMQTDLNQPGNVTVIYAFYGIPVPVSASGQLPQFSSLDRDGDGYISKSEAQASNQLEANFQTADDNSDGRIDQSEFSAFEETVMQDASGAAGGKVQKKSDTTYKPANP